MRAALFGLLLPWLVVGCQGRGMPEGGGERAVIAAPTAPASPTTSELASVSSPRVLSPSQVKLVEGARSTVGDLYDAGYYAGGPPPAGRGACTDVVYAAFKAKGLNLKTEMERDIAARPEGYPNLRDANIDYRWAPNQIVWFGRHAKKLPIDDDYEPGDVVFWSLLDDGVADHVGIVSDGLGTSAPRVIHNFPPACREDEALHRWTIVGHFRPR